MGESRARLVASSKRRTRSNSCAKRSARRYPVDSCAQTLKITPQLISERAARTTSTTLVTMVDCRISSIGVDGMAPPTCISSRRLAITMRVLSKRYLRADMMAANLNADWRYVHRQPALNVRRSLGGDRLWHPRDHTRRHAFFDRWLFLAD